MTATRTRVRLASLVTLAVALMATFNAAPALASPTAARLPVTGASLLADPRPMAETMASEVYLRLLGESSRARMVGATGAARSVAYVPRIRALPKRLRAAVMLGTARGDDNGLDADRLVTIWLGSSYTAACLNLRDGTIVSGRCGVASLGAPTLSDAYAAIYRTAVWLDRNASLYDITPRSADLMDHLAEADLGGMVTASYADAEGDRLIDFGGVTLRTATGECGAVALPDHDPAGLAYSATLMACPGGAA